MLSKTIHVRHVMGYEFLTLQTTRSVALNTDGDVTHMSATKE